MASSPAPDRGFDPEAEQEVDFARYARMLARRWWLVAAGVVAGAVIGYLVSLGGTNVYSATATIYLGQPYNPGGTSSIVTLQTNAGAVGQIANAQSVDDTVATQCKTTAKSFRKGISVQKVANSTSGKGLASQVNPLVALTVQTAKGKVATCVANALANAAVVGIGTYPEAKVKNYTAHIASDSAAIKQIEGQLESSNLSNALAAYLPLKLSNLQSDLENYQGLLLLTNTVELPSVIVPAHERQVTAQSSRNTVVIAAIIGLILGVLGALLWDRVLYASSRDGS